MKVFFKALLSLLAIISSYNAAAQDLASMYYYFNTSEQIREFIFTNIDNKGFILGKNEEQFTTHFPEFADEIFHHLTCSGDFDGDGKDEVAIFHRVPYRPNCFAPNCPTYYTANISLLKSNGKSFYAYGSWFSIIDSEFEPMMIRNAMSGDYNADGYDDIAIVFKDTFVAPATEHLAVFISNGSSFNAPQVFYNLAGSNYNTDSIRFAVGGDFNNDGFADIAIIYQDRGASPKEKNITIFESAGASFLPKKYVQLSDSFQIESIHKAFSGKFHNDNIDDIALLCETHSGNNNDSGKVIFVLENLNQSFTNPINYINLNNSIPDFSQMLLSAAGDVNRDGKTDIIYLYNALATSPLQYKIMVLPSTGTAFNTAETYFEIAADDFNMLRCRHLVCGDFSFENDVSATLWKHNAPSALTFSFDDGFAETIEYAKYLYTKDLSGSHNVISNESGNWLYVAWDDMRKDTLGNEYASHSHTHPFFNQIPLMAAANELTASKAMIDDSLNQTTQSFVFPYGAFSYEILQLPEMQNNYLSARTSIEGYNLATPVNFYALKSETIYNYTTVQDFIERVDRSKDFNYWLFMMFHYIGYTGNDPDLLDYNATVADFQAMVDYAAAQNIWVDTQEKITKYIKERNALKTNSYHLVDSNKILVKIVDGLDDAIYDVALTIKLKLPDTWNYDSLIVDKDSIKTKWAVINENSKNYLYFDALPDDSDLFIYPDLTQSVKAIFNPEKHVLKLWPNPASSNVFVAIPETYVSNCSLELYNSIGQLFYTFNNPSNKIVSIAREQIKSGLYFVLLKSEGRIVDAQRLIFK